MNPMRPYALADIETCKAKRGYESQMEAQRTLASIQRNHKLGHPVTLAALRVYKCRVCQKWHLGKRGWLENGRDKRLVTNLKRYHARQSVGGRGYAIGIWEGEGGAIRDFEERGES